MDQNILTKIQFQFDLERWVPSPSDLNQALKSKSSLFITTDQSIWAKYVSMVESNLNDIALGDIDALIAQITSPVIFSKLINP